MDSSQRAIVTCIHCLQHVERFFSTHFTDDDPVGTHTERIDHELSLTDGTLSFDVGRSRFQANDMVLVKLELGRVLDGKDPLAI